MLRIPKMKRFYSISLLSCLLCIFNINAQIGINTAQPAITLDVNGNFSLNGIDLSINNGVNDIVAGDRSFINLAGATGPFQISTIQSMANADGQIVTLVNTTPYSMTLVNNYAGSSNSIICPSNFDLFLEGVYSTATLQYNKGIQRWVVLRSADNGFYERYIYSNRGTSDIQKDSNIFSDMGSDMQVTFIPKNPIIYLNVSISGHMFTGNPNADAQGYGDFRVVKIVGASSTVVGGFTTLATDVDYLVVATPWNARMAMYPISVTPGQSTTIKVQWRRDGQNPLSLFCMSSSLPEVSHRSITIFD